MTHATTLVLCKAFRTCNRKPPSACAEQAWIRIRASLTATAPRMSLQAPAGVLDSWSYSTPGLDAAMLWSGHPIHPGSDQLIASSVSYKRLLGLGQTARLVRTAAIHLFFSAVSGCTVVRLVVSKWQGGERRGCRCWTGLPPAAAAPAR